VEEIMELVKGAGAFLASGHISASEVDAVVKRAKEIGCKVMVSSVSTDMPGYPLEAQERWASDEVFMEHDYAAVSEMPHVKTPIEVIVKQIRTVGAEKCIIASDAGNVKLPREVESMKDFIGRLIEAGITDREIDFMARRNPGILLGIS
jgi:hypothetical protein